MSVYNNVKSNNLFTLKEMINPKDHKKITLLSIFYSKKVISLTIIKFKLKIEYTI